MQGIAYKALLFSCTLKEKTFYFSGLKYSYILIPQELFIDLCLCVCVCVCMLDNKHKFTNCKEQVNTWPLAPRQ